VDTPRDPLQQPDPYTGQRAPTPVPLAAPGSADVPLVPKPDEPYVPRPRYEEPLVRNIRVGPIWVSAIQCARCGTVFAHGPEAVASDAPDPTCPRCTLVPLVPQPDVAAAMVELRWRYDQYVHAKGLSGASQKEQYDAFLRVHDLFWRHGPALLQELERVFGDQVRAGVAAIERGVAGVDAMNVG
jgi:hypothetical protein